MERYRDIIPDFDLFLDYLDKPLPTTLRVNPIKGSVEETISTLRKDGWSINSLDWYRYGFRVEGDNGIGNTLPHYLGWIHVQEEVSMLPPIVLNSSSEDTVLDLCAAPGGKATQLAVDTDNVVANDDDVGRIAALRNNSDRLGITNIGVTNYDGRRFPGSEFDSALVDAPCSSEGTARKLPQYRDGASKEEIMGIQDVQKGLLSRAIELVKPGETVVYSTCTFAPEENEAVLDHVIDNAEVIEFDTQLESMPGITSWNGMDYDREVRNAKRFYPHQNNTGGFFVAKLRVPE